MTRLGREVEIPERIQHGPLHRAAVADIERVSRTGRRGVTVYRLEFPCGARGPVRVPARVIWRREWPEVEDRERCKECYPDA